jgi:hypothetical protein
MTRRSFLTASAVVQAAFAQKKGPDLEVTETTARVEDRRINIDGTLRNLTPRPIKKLMVFYEVLDSDRNVLTKQNGLTEAGNTLEPGEETTFHAQIAWHARSISLRLSFEDASGRELRAENMGPFPID